MYPLGKAFVDYWSILAYTILYCLTFQTLIGLLYILVNALIFYSACLFTNGKELSSISSFTSSFYWLGIYLFKLFSSASFYSDGPFLDAMWISSILER